MEAALPFIFVVQRAEHSRTAQGVEALELAGEAKRLLQVSDVLAGAPVARAVSRLADELVHMVLDVGRWPLQLSDKAERGRDEEIACRCTKKQAKGTPAPNGDPLGGLAKGFVSGLGAFPGADEVAEILARCGALRVRKAGGH